MDFEQNHNQSEQPYVSAESKPRKKRKGWRIFWGIFTGMSVIGNIFLLLMLIAVAGVLAVGHKGIFTEELISPGPKTTKIVVVNLRGVIDAEKSRDMQKQIKTAAQDHNVKALILRVNSPGGSVSASDRIYNQIRWFRAETGKPAVAFMEGLAASGGYYASVACEKIVAEPTTITGSIGAIMGYFVLQQLLEEKLGIVPVIVKSGEKKDWPNSFAPPSEEQRLYLQEKLITPAYERFVELVADGRKTLTLDDVRRLADGSIYSAAEAYDENLIDQIGYLDDAVTLAKSLAGIEDAQVVEYAKPFSLASLLNAHNTNILKLNKPALHELNTPQLLYLWSAY